MGSRHRYLAGVVVLLVSIITASTVWLAGYRMFYVVTPSMGTAMPVGSLTVTVPAAVDDISVGDVVTTRLQNGATRTHRVIEETEAGLLTKGDLNKGTDAGATTDRNLVGRMEFNVPVLGWLVQMIPWIAGMWLIMWLVSTPLKDEVHRSRYRVTGLFLGFALSIVLVRPLLGTALLSMPVDSAAGTATANVVSTGLLPVRVEALGEGGEPSEVMYRSGAQGHAVIRETNDRGEFVALPRPVLTWPWIVAGLFLLASPWAWFYLQYRRNRINETESGDSGQLEEKEKSAVRYG